MTDILTFLAESSGKVDGLVESETKEDLEKKLRSVEKRMRGNVSVNQLKGLKSSRARLERRWHALTGEQWKRTA
jgi:hypothetical protein